MGHWLGRGSERAGGGLCRVTGNLHSPLKGTSMSCQHPQLEEGGKEGRREEGEREGREKKRRKEDRKGEEGWREGKREGRREGRKLLRLIGPRRRTLALLFLISHEVPSCAGTCPRLCDPSHRSSIHCHPIPVWAGLATKTTLLCCSAETGCFTIQGQSFRPCPLFRS